MSAAKGQYMMIGRDEGPTGPVEEPQLTTREWQVLELVAEGQTDQEVADALSISSSTVHGHLRHISEKLGVHGRTNLANWYHGRNGSANAKK